MPTYAYSCEACGRESELRCSFSDRPTHLDCPCGSEAMPRITGGAASFMRNRPYEFNRGRNVRSFGRKFGRTDQQQHDMYRRHVESMQREKRAAKASGKKPDIEWLGCMPGEMVDSIGQNEGDKEAVYKDPVSFLKKTDLYAGD